MAGSIPLWVAVYALTCVSVACGIPAAPTTQQVEGKHSWVYQVVSTTTQKPEAGLGDDIYVRVANLDSWINTLNSQSRSSKDKRKWAAPDLVPIIDGILLPGTHPQSIQSQEATDDDKCVGAYKLTTLQFHLGNDSGTKEAWNNLLNHPQIKEKPVTLTLGMETQDFEPLSTVVDKSNEAGATFSLIVIRTGLPLVFGILVIVGSLVIFFSLASRTTLLRDTTSTRRPDGQWPFSLARAQMAFWFFLVIVSFFLLWLVTGAQDTITTSVLTLIGISAGTALGAAVVDSGKRNDGPDYQPIVPPGTKDAVTLLRDQVAERKAALSASQAALNAALTANAPVADVEAARQKVAADQNVLERTRSTYEFCQRKPWKRVMYDLLGDSGSIGFHRFQIAVWTLVLGIIFVSQVYSQLSMPTFSNTLLGLMGISAGTYIGFKIPEGAPAKPER